MNIILIALSIRHGGDWDKIFEALENKEPVDTKELKEIEKMVKSSTYKVITILDRDYPKELKTIYKPPFCIWVHNNNEQLKGNNICVAGNQHDIFSKERIKNFVPEIEKNFNIIVPGFKGVDQDVFKTAINPVVHIMPHGFDEGMEKKSGVYISEYPPGKSPSKDTYRNRNRIIAGYSDSLILITSEKNGKINHLVTEFLNNGKEIYAFPGNGDANDGNSELIKQGANLITSIKDVSLN